MRLVCVANSRRPDGRCIAGIDVETGQFIRPVGPATDAIPEHRVAIDGRLIEVGDILEMELRTLGEAARFQCENRLIVDWNWRRVGQVAKSWLLDHCEDPAPVLYSKLDRVLPAAMEKLPSTSWRSLQLIRPRRLTFERDGFDQHRWRARFQDKARNEYLLRITDPLATHRLETAQPMGNNIIFLVSLTKPWKRPDGSSIAMCYKIVATVIEL